MIAVVSSTLQPAADKKKRAGLYSFEERLSQTQKTLTALYANGFQQIFLVDNSPDLNADSLGRYLNNFPDINILHIQQFQFPDKGLNELHMLLYATNFLPPDQDIFKISGRYWPDENFLKPVFKDFAFKPYAFRRRNGIVSTRGYWVKGSVIFRDFLLQCIAETYIYPSRIVGMRSLLRKIIKKDSSFSISIEFAAANVLKASKFEVTFLSKLGVEGWVAGAEHVELLKE